MSCDFLSLEDGVGLGAGRREGLRWRRQPAGSWESDTWETRLGTRVGEGVVSERRGRLDV
ncbi:Hypothetical predicted protein [Prunus dulcis]|uniref:Uncharacterized protein n=1 Tax=Prunus dulcis TaxID=3755 RepID=A0A5E4EFD3_PRUDU|nr:Hypothetical predicted protein [Prunus dulcis]